ncbi:MAG: hypothetical protein ACKOE4_04600, partial [Candidatus Kapaibacterium sp.]
MSTRPMISGREHITRRLSSVIRREQGYRTLRGFATSFAAACGLALVVSLLEAWLQLGVPLRTLIWWGSVLSVGVIFGVTTLPSLLRFVGLLPVENAEQAALRVGEVYSEISDALSNALQLTRENETPGDLAEAAFATVASVSSDRDFSAIIDRQPTRKAFLWAFILAAIFTIALNVWPGLVGAAWERVCNYSTSYVPPAPFRLTVEGMQDTVMRGSSSSVLITAHGTPPESITLNVREKGASQFTQHTLRRDSANVYSFMLAGLTQSVEFFAESPWLDTKVISDTDAISVIDRPLIRALSGSVTPPSYARLAASRLDATHADVTTIAGSSVRLLIESNKELKRAYIVLH